jgi:hypothetical protein
VTRPAEDRLARALDRIQVGRPGALEAEDGEVAELLQTAGFLQESLTRVPAPDTFRVLLRDWLAKPRRRPWWQRLMAPVGRRIPRAARRPALGAAIGLGAAAAIAVGIVALRRRRLASAA